MKAIKVISEVFKIVFPKKSHLKEVLKKENILTSENIEDKVSLKIALFIQYVTRFCAIVGLITSLTIAINGVINGNINWIEFNSIKNVILDLFSVIAVS